MPNRQEKPNNIKYFLWAALVIVLDQITKLSVQGSFVYQERVNVIPSFFDLTLLYNPGAAFSFLADAGGWQKYFFFVLALAVSAYLAYGIVKNQFSPLAKWAAACIMGGAIGNVIDRGLHGHVIDFLLFYYQNWFYPAFNLADSFIFIGAALLIVDTFKSQKK